MNPSSTAKAAIGTPSVIPRQSVAAYVRMSTEHQKYSIANQLCAIERFCALHAMDLVRIYSDAGRSGLSAANRPGLKGLIAEAGAPSLPFSAVIVLDVSRWGRFQNVDEGAYYEHLLKRAGAPVLYCAEAFENDGSPGSAIIKAVKRAMAAEFSRELSSRTAAGARRIAAQGWRACAAAGLGYRRVIIGENGQILHQAERGEHKALQGARTTLMFGPGAEVEAIRRMFGLYVQDGLTIRAVCQALVAEGRPSPTTLGWSPSVVGDLLRNEKYAGISVYGKLSGPLSRRKVKADPANWVVVDQAHPAIISLATFEAAQRRRAQNLRHHRAQDVTRGLRRLFRHRGMLSRSLIDQCAYLPSSTHVCKMFGSLERAYEIAKIPSMTLSEKRAVTRARKLRGHAHRRRAVGERTAAGSS